MSISILSGEGGDVGANGRPRSMSAIGTKRTPLAAGSCGSRRPRTWFGPKREAIMTTKFNRRKLLQTGVFASAGLGSV